MSHKMKMLTLILSITITFSLSLYATGSMEESPSRDKIIFYASGPATMLEKLEQTFEKEHGDVIDVVLMGCGPLRQRVWTEFESGAIKADVFWGSDPLLFNSLDEKGALEAYVPTGIDSLKDEYRTDHNYTYTNERYGVIIYNGDKLKGDAIPTSYQDLLDPSLKGKITHADPSQSSTALALVASIWDMFDRDWNYQRNLIANGLFLAKKNSDVPSKIQEGEFDVGIAPHDAVVRLQKKAKKDGYPTPLKISWPTDGAIAIVRPIAISKNAARSIAKQEITHNFIDFMISKEAQMITNSFAFVSVRDDVPLTQGVPANLTTRVMNWDELSKVQDTIRDEFKKISK